MPDPHPGASCHPCRYWMNDRPVLVAGKYAPSVRCKHWYSTFPNGAVGCPRFEREPGADDE